MKIGVCLPLHSTTVEYLWSSSLGNTHWPEGSMVSIEEESAAMIQNAMPIIVKKHLEHGCDYIVGMARDVGWNPDDIKKLIAYNLPVVGGWASGRKYPFPCHVSDAYDAKSGSFRIVKNEDAKQRKGVERVVANGGELVVFRRDVFEKIPYPWFCGPETYSSVSQRIGTEDYFFAQQAMKYGVDIYVDWDVKLKHVIIGAYVQNGTVFVS
ncbi:MAG: hypothetical protein PHW65_00110 [Dehalococcoidales bacterium]|nr:hypothetical protein [Dehalococcoidales bacterium]